jgi:CDP-diacylglycerol--serine O-phosphatidyltransferase
MHNKNLPLIYIFPNLVTVISLCFGMSSIKYGLDSRWELAVGLLVASAFLDGMDGRLARMLNASSKFGAELDSLTDFINFGVAPALILYSWGLNLFPLKGFGWAIALTFAICSAFRLARFNSELNIELNSNKNFFTGIPAPCAAGLAIMPIMLSFELDIFFFQQSPIFLAIYILIIAFMMVSLTPTISVKNLHISSKLLLPTLFLCSIFIILLITKPWITLPVMGAIYLVTIPISIYKYSKNA